ncbi:MAG: iron-containing alcohol dehydrogenase [Sphaerochaetaceae bacterium]|jgi:alcohol dehydrogenase class IV
MIPQFSISATGNLLFGEGTFAKLAQELQEREFSRVALSIGNGILPSDEVQQFLKDLNKSAISSTVIEVVGEPSVTSIDESTLKVKEGECEVIVGIGGGSALDTAKAVAVMAKQGEQLSVKRFLEGVGDLTPPAIRLPLYAVPTTAGTGSEATKNAVISEVGQDGFKKSLRHDNYIPDLVIIDPKLALSAPRSVTAASGLDALTQLLEAFTSVKANPFIDSLALTAIAMVGNALPRLLSGEEDSLELRGEMAYAAYISGMAIANAGLGYVHGLAGPMGSLHNVPHGVVCGLLMPEINKALLAKGEKGSLFLTKMERVASLWRVAGIEGVVDRLEELKKLAALPHLAFFGFTKDELTALAKQNLKRNSPLELEEKTVVEILHGLL